MIEQPYVYRRAGQAAAGTSLTPVGLPIDAVRPIRDAIRGRVRALVSELTAAA